MKKLIKILPVVLMVCLVFTSAYAIGVPNSGSLTGNQNGASGVINTAQNIWATVVTVVQILSVAAVVFAGLRYMFASADQKADIKKSMGILAIGAVLVFGATTLLGFITSVTNQVIKNN